MILFQIKKKKDQKYDKDFIQFLLNLYLLEFQLLVNDKEQKKFDAIEDTIKEVLELDDNFNLLDVCINSIETAKIVETPLSFIVSEDQNEIKKNPLGLDYVIIVNDGNLGTFHASSIFTRIAKYITDNIDDLYNIYEMGVLI